MVFYFADKLSRMFLLTMLLLPLSAHAQNFARGKELFEHHCHVCHDDLRRADKEGKVRNAEDLKQRISSWAVHSGADWGESEVNDVLYYMDRSFYRFRKE